MKNSIKIQRAVLNITQEELAKLVHVSRQTINAIESNKYVFATMTDVFNSLMKICDSNSIGNMNPATLSKEIKKYSSLLESIGIVIIEGGKVDSGRVYLFIAEDYVDSNIAVELEKIKLNPSLICKEYCNINGIK